MTGLLDGLRILELGHYVAAPFCTRLLGDLGAEIIKIEPLDGDPARQWGAQVEGRSLWWSQHGRNKRSLALNLKAPEAREIVVRLAAGCDAVVENFRPGQLVRLGLGPDVLRAARPDLVIAHISGFGQDGPHRDRAAFGVIGEAIGGLRYLTNQPPEAGDLPPVRVGVSLGDSVAGLYAAFGVMAALWDRDRTDGPPQPRSLDVALADAVLSLMEGMLPEYGALGRIKQPTGGGIATAAPSNAYPTADGGWILIAANSEPLFAKLALLIGRPDLASDPAYSSNPARVANAAQLDALISAWTRDISAESLAQLLLDADIPACKAYTAADIAKDPQFLHRQMVRQVDDALFAAPVLQTGIVPHVIETPGAVRRAGAALGADTDEILVDQLGLTPTAVQSLKAQGVVA